MDSFKSDQMINLMVVRKDQMNPMIVWVCTINKKWLITSQLSTSRRLIYKYRLRCHLRTKVLTTTKNYSHSVSLSSLLLTNYTYVFFLAQRKVEYENFRFKHPTLLAVVIESINVKVIDNQRLIGRFFFRFHVSDDLTIGELSEIMKFKINAKL